MSTSRAPFSRKSSAVRRMTIVPLAGLVQTEGVLAGTVHYLTANVIVIGGAPDNDIRLGDREVSPHHACIRKSRAGNAVAFQIYDLASSSGVRVNGLTVAMRHPLAQGDRITIGRAVLEFFVPTG
ncbi:MAG: FHA domain-containing protein [Anaerolineae bacterium]